jgi:hypothetical protein
MKGKITSNIPALMQEANINQIDLSRETRLAPGTIGYLSHGIIGKSIYTAVLEKLCVFFTERLGRPIGPGDVLIYDRDYPPADL